MDERSKDQDLQTARETPDGHPLTTNQGVVIADNQNSLTGGQRGPTLLEDFIFREKITHFDHERIPERVVHARGSGAHGYFQVYEPMAEFSAAKFLQDPAVQTPVFVRFSTVVGSRGSADTVRDVRGFATKFYTEDGIFDLVGNNIPIFFIQDAIKFPDLIHAVKPEPDNEMPQAQSAHDTFWDFAWLTPESTHMLLWIMSDRAIPRSFRMMEGFGVNTYRLVNAQGKSRLVKFHWKPLLGKHSLLWDEAQKLAGKDPDFHRRDLWDAIEMGDYPEFEFGIQTIEETDELQFDFDPLDATKIWPEALVPVRRIGKMTLNRNPDNFFGETEQAAFHVGHVVPGIDFSNDPLLQGRIFSYLDTQLLRLGGPNFAELPINRSLAPVHNNQRDGFKRHTLNTAKTSYQPNSLGGGCPMQDPVSARAFVSYAEQLNGPKMRHRSETFSDHFGQATMFWNSQSDAEKEHIVRAFRFELGKCGHKEVRAHVVDLLTNVDVELAARVAQGIGVPVPSGTQAVDAANQRLQQGWKEFGATVLPGERRTDPKAVAPETSMANPPSDSIKTRRIALLAADGFDDAQLTGMQTALKAAGAVPELIGPFGTITSADGKEVPVDKTLLTVDSVLYDAVFVAGGQQSVTTLLQEGDALIFIHEAFRHCKAIGAVGEGVDLLLAANLLGPASNGQQLESVLTALPGVVAVRQAKDLKAAAQQFIQAIAQDRFFAREKQQHLPT